MHRENWRRVSVLLCTESVGARGDAERGKHGLVCTRAVSGGGEEGGERPQRGRGLHWGRVGRSPEDAA